MQMVQFNAMCRNDYRLTAQLKRCLCSISKQNTVSETIGYSFIRDDEGVYNKIESEEINYIREQEEHKRHKKGHNNPFL